MSMTYAQVATHASEPLDPPSTLVHSRNLSNVSSATLHTSTTLHSQPYEPLLRPITPTPASGDFYDVASHQSRASDRILSLPRWSQSNVMSRNPSNEPEKKGSSSYVDTIPRIRARRIRWSKRLLETVMVIWAIYSTARYLLAFMIYDSTTGQAFALVMGVCTGLSFAFTSCAVILSFAQNSLVIHGFSVRALISLQSTLQYLASCCFLAPTIANFVLIFVWKKTSDLELQTRHRCRLDVDLIWSTTSSLCNHKTYKWASWITLSALRIVLTLIIIIVFHLIASSQQFMPVRRISKLDYAKSKKSHTRLESCQTPLMPYLHREPNVQQQASDSTLSGKSSPRNRLRPTRSRSSGLSEEGLQSEAPSYNNENFLLMNSSQPEPDRELGGFVDRFRHLISQITRETEEGLAFARSDDSSSSRNTRESPPPRSSPSSSEIDVENAHRHPDFHYDDDDDFYTSSSPRAVPSGNYHQLYPEDEQIHMMNGIVRRMPTIQSLGSREMRSSMGASSTHTNRDRAPTRNTVISWTGTDLSIGSEPARSRPNSLTAQAERLAGMFGKMHASEIGELLRRENTVRMVDSGSLSIPDDISEALPEYDSTTSGTSGSKATTDSFHTASSGGTQNSMTRALKDAVRSPMELPAHLQVAQGEDEEPER